MLRELKHKSSSKKSKKNGKADAIPSENEILYGSSVKFLQQISQADLVLQLVDARNPTACRYGPYEEAIGRKLCFILNKIDLVPREVASAWLRCLQSTALTFAIQANKDCSCIKNLIERLPKGDEKVKILITGFSHTGKHTLAAELGRIPGVTICVGDSWKWMEVNSDLVAMGCSEVSSILTDSIRHARDFLSRCSIHSVMEAFKVPFFNDVDIVFPAIQNNKRAASLELFRGLIRGDWHFYTAPPGEYVSDKLTGIPEDQQESLKNAKKWHSCEVTYMVLGYGNQNAMKPAVVSLMKSNPKLKK